MQPLTISDAQKKVDEWIKTVGVKYFSELTNLGILMEEVGELSRIIVREYGDQSFKKNETGLNKADEIADIFWVLICLANQMNIDLEEALLKNIEKKTNRDQNRHKENPKLK
jgi:NTP pyrophosphatase (non-canonical NTP hydrolase)